MAEEEKQKEGSNELEKLHQQAEEYLAGWKRAKADYINREKEIASEKAVLKQVAQEMVFLEFLPILDNLNSALEKCGELNSPHNKWVEGVAHIKKQFENTLNNFGVQGMDLLGKEFDPRFCEAIEKKDEGNKIIKVILNGYKKGDRIIRPARVIIG